MWLREGRCGYEAAAVGIYLTFAMTKLEADAVSTGRQDRRALNSTSTTSTSTAWTRTGTPKSRIR